MQEHPQGLRGAQGLGWAVISQRDPCLWLEGKLKTQKRSRN